MPTVELVLDPAPWKFDEKTNGSFFGWVGLVGFLGGLVGFLGGWLVGVAFLIVLVFFFSNLVLRCWFLVGGCLYVLFLVWF